jgi:hypothetical protein
MITIYKQCCAVGSLPVELDNTSGTGKCRSTETNNTVLPSKGTIWGADASSHLFNLESFFGFPKNRKKYLIIGKRGGKSPKKSGKF